ncbi:MAG: matrixin family metalloprotease [Flavobacteriales bacterium]
MKSLTLLLLSFCLFSCYDNPAGKKIAIQTLGYFPKEFKDSVAAAIHHFYAVEVVELPTQKIPESFFINVKSPRYRADSIIKMLNNEKPDTVAYVLALTAADISVTKNKKPEAKYKDWGVFGYGYVGKPGCVVSSYRIKHAYKKVMLMRLQKIALHEIGHNLGLPHCSSQNCFMRDAAESIKTIDKVEMNLCEKCKKKVALF